MIGLVIMACLTKTHEVYLDAIILPSLHTFHTMGLDLVLRFLCDVSDTLIADKEIDQVSRDDWLSNDGMLD